MPAPLQVCYFVVVQSVQSDVKIDDKPIHLLAIMQSLIVHICTREFRISCTTYKIND